MKLGVLPDDLRVQQSAIVKDGNGHAKSVNLAELITEQPRLNAARLLAANEEADKAKPVVTASYKGKTYLLEGNHRAFVAWLKGHKQIKSLHTDLDHPQKTKTGAGDASSTGPGEAVPVARPHKPS